MYLIRAGGLLRPVQVAWHWAALLTQTDCTKYESYRYAGFEGIKENHSIKKILCKDKIDLLLLH